MKQAAWLALLALALTSQPAPCAPEHSIEPAGTIRLPGVSGRIDHFAVDLAGQRLFVAALGNDTTEVIDLKAGVRQKSVRGLAEPQGVAYVPTSGRLFVANGGAGRVDILDGTSLATIRRIDGLDDADNVRYDAKAERIYVGYGGGALRVLDARSGDSLADIRLAGHPESFQLERRGERIFVNVPTVRQVAVVDRIKGAVVATWALHGAAVNFPMALDEPGQRLYVGARRPARLLVFDTRSGKQLDSVPIGGDTDDLYVDTARRRVYAVCGEGVISVVERREPERYVVAATIRTAPRARTGLFVPDLERLYVAVPARSGSGAEVRIYRVR